MLKRECCSLLNKVVQLQHVIAFDSANKKHVRFYASLDFTPTVFLESLAAKLQAQINHLFSPHLSLNSGAK